MKQVCLLLLIALAAACASVRGGSAPVAADLAFTHVAVVDVETGSVLPDQTVLIAGNRIAAVGPAAGVHIPSGTRVIEAKGRYLIPGLWDMHAHTVDDRITREIYLPLYLANGVTGIRNMHADCFEPCGDDRTKLAEVRQWQREIAAGQLVGPRMVAASEVIHGPPPGEASSVERPTTEAEARALVGLLKERGVDLIKIYDTLPREAYFALADEARKQGIPFAGHVPVEVRASEASDAGQRSIEHLVGVFEECSAQEDELRPRLVAQWGTPGFADLALAMAESHDAAKCARLYERFARNQTWQVPNLLVWEMRERIGDELWQDHPHLQYMPTPEREYWAWRLRRDAEFWTGGLKAVEPMNRLFREMVAAMAPAGVGILAGTDAGMPFVFPGFSLHEELELLVSASLTPAEALRAATLSAAEYLEATDSLGSVAPDRLADLVLLDANPLEDIRNTQRLRAVVFDGRYFDRTALDEVLAGVEEAARASTIHVAPPTGELETDRASIQAAPERVQPGGTAGEARERDPLTPSEIQRLDSLARTVTIYRDTYGVPHVHGPTDAAAVFGSAYAYLEDRFHEVEPRFIESLGRAAKLRGEAGVVNDIFVRALQLERLAREEYAAASPAVRAIAEAFTDGYNYFLHRNADVEPLLIERFHPWMVFAAYRRSMGVSPDRVGIAPEELLAAIPPQPDTPRGSNAWAVAASRSASGNAMILLNPHTPLVPVYEVHLRSDEGLDISGPIGFTDVVVPVMGRNQHLAWALTVNDPDVADVYETTFDHPTDRLAYRHGDGWRRAVEWSDTIRVRLPDGRLEDRVLTLRRTHHGPILAERDGKHLAVRFAQVDRGGALQQWYAMGRARNREEFRAALSIRGLSYHNVMYADTGGNIWYVYSGAIPRRDPSYDWSRPVDGSDPGTEWQGYHEIDELPQVLNPRSGWMQNTNSTPFLTTAPGENPDPTAYPAYMVGEGDNWRSRASRRILGREGTFTFDEWAELAFDTYFFAADRYVPDLVDEWRRLLTADPRRAEAVAEPVRLLASWDRRGAVDSEATTIFTLWRGLSLQASGADAAAYPLITALEAAVAFAGGAFGDWWVPWGEINRHQRPLDTLTGAFSPDRPSLAVPAAHGDLAGSIFSYSGRLDRRAGKLHGAHGHGYVSVVELGSPIRALSILPYGVSADPDSPHFEDQARLYVAGRFKPAWFTRDEILANLGRAYHPGERQAGVAGGSR